MVFSKLTHHVFFIYFRKMALDYCLEEGGGATEGHPLKQNNLYKLYCNYILKHLY